MQKKWNIIVEVCCSICLFDPEADCGELWHTTFLLGWPLFPHGLSFILSFFPFVSLSSVPSYYCSLLFWVVFESTWTSSPSSAAYWPRAELSSESIGWERGVPQLYWMGGKHSNWPPALYSRAAVHFPCRGKHCVQCERISWKSSSFLATPSTTGGLNDRLTDWLLHSQFTFTLMIRF